MAGKEHVVQLVPGRPPPSPQAAPATIPLPQPISRGSGPERGPVYKIRDARRHSSRPHEPSVNLIRHLTDALREAAGPKRLFVWSGGAVACCLPQLD